MSNLSLLPNASEDIVQSSKKCKFHLRQLEKDTQHKNLTASSLFIPLVNSRSNLQHHKLYGYKGNSWINFAAAN